MKHAGRLQFGVATVELALLLFPLVTLVVGVAEYGRAMYQYNALAKAVRTGARYLSQYHAGDAASIAAAKCLVAFGNTACNEPALAPNLTTSLVQVADASSDPASFSRQPVSANGVTVGVTNLVRVRVEGFQFTSIGSWLVGDFQFDSISVTMTQALP